MGPVRGGLILAALSGPLQAGVCETERPGWDGTSATPLSEALLLYSTPLGIALLIATALAIRFRSAWGGLAVTVGWTIFVTLVVSTDASDTREIAIAEGCIGPPTLFITATIAICIATILYTARPGPGDN